VDPVSLGFAASLASGLLTGVGAAPVLLGHSVSQRVSDTLLGFAAGVMLAASFFSLIIPGLEAARSIYGDGMWPPAIAVVGVLLGAAFIALLNDVVPHEHIFLGREGASPGTLSRVWLFVLAITIHNLPEGLAVGVGFAGGDFQRGSALAIGIGLQNAPEGLAVALALLSCGYRRTYSFMVTTLTGLVEPVTGLLGAYAVSLSTQLLPWGMTFAAGAMIYVISHEIIPETHRRGSQNEATLGLMAGLVLMMFLDVAFTSN
jgi:ZIP family zinc transporter